MSGVPAGAEPADGVLAGGVPAASEPVDLATLVAAGAHELRSPLAAVRGMAQLLRERWPQLDDTQRDELLAAIDRDTRRMSRLVDELVDVSRLESGRFGTSPMTVSLPGVVEEAVRRVAVTHPRLRVDTSVAADVPPARTDPDRVVQILANLLENAAKYATGAQATVRVTAADGRVELRVDDRGPGLPAGARAAVFAPHTRVAGQPSGLGLGLWISRRVADALGATLTAEANEHGGTSFRLTLPAG